MTLSQKYFQMNMRYSSLYVLGLVGLFSLASCSQDAVEPVHKDVPSIVLRASYGGDPETRTSFGDFTSNKSFAEIRWNEGDAVNIFYGAASSADPASARFVTATGGKTAAFSPADEGAAEDMAGAARLYGLYPYADGASASFANAKITTAIPSVQEAVSDSFDPQSFLAVGLTNTVSNTPVMAFYNVCGGICFTLENPSRYSSIELYGNSGESVCGDIEISMSNPATPVARAVGTSSEKKITLTSPAGGFQAGKRYYISLLPGDFASGFTMKFNSDGGASFERTCTSRVSFRRGAFAFVSDVDNASKLASIRDGELLSTETETANCYVVSAPGTYKFPLVRGINPEAVLTNVDAVETLWETTNTASAPARGSVVSEVTINKGMVYFKVPDPVRNGNALVAAKSADGTILWSWHIWVCRGYDPEGSSHRLEGKTKPMMDRNLGALAASPSDPLSNGLFYQWGRKDPFPGALERYVEASEGGTLFKTTGGNLQTKAAEVSVNIAYAVAHPTEYITSTDNHWLTLEDNTLWNNVKNDYDPCPIGWKVPRCYSYTASVGHNYNEEAWGNVPYVRYQSAAYGYGAYFTLAGGGQSWYPNTGYLSINGQLLMVGQYSVYWSCDPMSSYVYGLEMSQNMRGEITLNPYQGGKGRGEGHAVRCIKDN